jgi:copper(I)-binding protein
MCVWPLRASRLSFLALAFVVATCDAQGVVTINEPWARVAANGRSAEAYMRVTSSDGATLVSASSVAARRVRIVGPGDHGASTQVELPARRRVDLARGQYRIRLDGFEGATRPGARIPIILTMRRNDGSILEISADAEVRLHSPTEDESRPHRSHGRLHEH